ncbi:hypothetical protein FB570_111224 [Streptomyces sp. T12]|uniref:CU044_5270 family protein n=1 Tax=Streptomyces sp. T12 TaxID=477697 RepID=UPI00119DA4E7|nr:CU044_5270 family protein [Streptomyces sp. T12]TWD17611.1 hypothetical protein FB570_111224 [Streptomyces sp. T12]
MTTSSTSGRPDVLQILADARPDELDPTRFADSPRQREDLARILANIPAHRIAPLPAARSWWSRRRFGTVAALTAVTASVVVVAGPDWRNQPDDGRARPHSSTALMPDARLLLLSAATKAETSPSEGTYWQTDSQSAAVEVVGEAGHLFAVRTASSSRWSVGVREASKSLRVNGLNFVTEPLTAADHARWREAGSPGTVFSAASPLGDEVKFALTMGTRRPTVTRTDFGDKIYALGPHNVSYRELRDLPATKSELRQLLERLHAEDDGAHSAADRSAWLLRVAADLVTMPVKPGVRAAAYRLMADLPGVQVDTGVTDPLGRVGVGVTFPGTSPTPLGGVRQQLVVDPSSGELLAEQTLLIEPSAKARGAGLKAGTAVNYSAMTRMTWSEEQIALPRSARR